MSDAISRSALMEFARNHIGHTVDINDIARFPALDVAPVVHAYWKMTDSSYCSHCNLIAALKTRFCPHCGARMDGDEHAVD